ncbi:formyltransferase family protein [Halorubellus litoreus]|uniref:Formyltransferase family protein n=1 Tax=Halorubellus litoreus TaxID=755308 RepID=A0ABD5VG95_9EURY
MTLRTTVVTQDDPFYVPHFFEAFFDALDDDVVVDRVVCLRPFDERTVDLARRMFRFYGPRNFAIRSLQYAYRTVMDGIGDNAFSVATVAAANDVPVEERNTVNDDGFVDGLRERDVDVVLSVSAPEIFEVDVLDAPNWGCLNVHTADLPKYRGMMPTFWALYHGDDEIGVTVHTMEEELDRGNAVRSDSFPVTADDTLDDVILEGKRRGGRAAAYALGDVARDEVTERALTGESSYFSFPTRAERRELQDRGRNLL